MHEDEDRAQIARLKIRVQELETEVERLGRIETDLLECRRNFIQIEQIARVGRWELDLVSNRLEWSDGVFSIFQIAPDRFEATYEAFLDIVHPDDRALVERTYTASIDNETTYDLVHRVQVPGVGVKWVREAGWTEYGPDGRPRRSIGTVQDVTEIRQAQEALRVSEARYRHLFHEAFDGIALADIETGIIVDCNQALGDMVERDREEIVGQRQSTLHPPDDRTDGDFTKAFDAHRGNREGQIIEERLLTRTGEIRFAEIKAKIVEIEGRRYLFGFFRDVTEMKKALDALKDSEERFRQLVENIREVFWMRDAATGGILYANPAYESIWGRSPEGLYQDPSSFLELVHEDDRDRLQQAMDARERDNAPFAQEYRIVRPDGEVRWIWSRTYPVRNDEGHIIRWAGIAEDVTDKKRLEEKLLEMATTDFLTGARNRMSFTERGDEEFARFNRYGKPFSILMLDIDHFKEINDQYGHAAGDDVLRALSGLSRGLLRTSDAFGRLGGEEFAVLLPETRGDRALEAAERLRSGIADMKVRADGHEVSVTVSVGVAWSLAGDPDMVSVLKKADQALYQAKRAGRNRVVAWEE
ncbi:MAG: diguanylate cyclase [Proteobacteria bacterium]|nr:diguanylate cyclase [Pseudomonadota bacterium]